MAMKKARQVKQPNKTNKSDDAVIYNVTIALALVCLGILMLLRVSQLTLNLDTMVQTYEATTYVAVAGAALAAVSLAVYLFCKVKVGKLLSLLGLIIFGTIAVSALLLHMYWTLVIPLLYAAYICAGVLYLIYAIYQKEFFLVSGITACAGFCFYVFSLVGTRSLEFYALCLLLALIAIGASALAYKATKNSGWLQLGKVKLQLLAANGSAQLLYITSAVWILCLIAILLLGGTFAYYCMFAAIIYELIAACYYTIKLT